MNDEAVLQHEQVMIFIGVNPVAKTHFGPDFGSNRIAFRDDTDYLDFTGRRRQQHAFDRIGIFGARHIAAADHPPGTTRGLERLYCLKITALDRAQKAADN